MVQQRRVDARKGGEQRSGITSPYYLVLTKWAWQLAGSWVARPFDGVLDFVVALQRLIHGELRQSP